MPSEEHEPPKRVPQASACARAAVPRPATHPVGQRPPGLARSRRSGRAPQARAASRHPPGPAAVARAAGRGRRRAARPALLEAALPRQKLGHRKAPGANQARTGGAAAFPASPSHRRLQGTKGEIWAPDLCC